MKNIHQQYSQAFSKISGMIGTPYSDMDCWDIVSLFYKEIFNEELNLLYDYKINSSGQEWAKSSNKIIIDNASKFKRVKNPDFGDIILMRVWGIPSHVGIFLDQKNILHTSEKTGCVIDSHIKWKNRIEGYYRWPKFA